MKYEDKTTWVKCDGCGSDGQCRFFEILTDAGAQVTVWWDEPKGWIMCPLSNGEVKLACSPACAMDLSKEEETNLLRALEKQHESPREKE